MINGNNSYWQNASMNIRKDEDEWRLAKDTVPAPSELGTKEITENGDYSAKDDGLDGYSDVNVAVSNTYTAGDEGKVVSSGALVSQSSSSTTTNGTVDTTLINSLNVNVANTYVAGDEGKVVYNGALVSQTAYPTTVTQNDTYDTTNYNSITVNVSGGGGGGADGTDVIFYDYDGTIVTSYSAAEFANLSAMPENPTHTGLTAQGWNWALSDAKTYVAANGKLDIGQMYITSDGKTRLYYVIPKDNLTLDLYLELDEDAELDIDWGDNSEHTTWTSNDGDSSKSHTYSDGGRYTVAITVVSGGFNCQSSGNEDYTLKKVELGSGVTSIGYEAFYYCYTLSSITIPNSVEYIGDSAFYYCYALSSVTIPNSVTTIGDNAFNNCYSLSSITIPDSATTIGDSAFEGCYALSSVTIPNSVTSIGDSAFSNCYSLSSITIPDSVTTIGSSSFSFCQALSSVTIPDSVTEIGNEAFSYCYGLSSVTIPDGVTSIGYNAFESCYALSSITIPDGVTTIESSTFNNCYGLSSVTIPDGVTTIESSPFGYCQALSSITFESATPPDLYGNLDIPATCIIRVPQGTLSDYTSASDYPDPSEYIYEEY